MSNEEKFKGLIEDKMDVVKFFKSYDYLDEWLLVEMTLDLRPSEIDWSGFCVPEKDVDKDDWQVPYMEQYLNEDGTKKICETYCIPDTDGKPCRVAFFIFRRFFAHIFSTPYGDFELTDDEHAPDRLTDILEFYED
ncbi:MAG: hypothetical protein IJS94_06885 [Clostridia bacterium]|nr:hypothetical protein [Clostridia bacterium]